MTFLKAPPSTPDAVADEYAATISGTSLARYRIPETSSDRRAIFDLERDELFMEGNSRQNVATFCTTYADDKVRRLMDLSIDKNVIDKDEYPQTAEIEMRCVHKLADLWHATKSWKTTGCSTTGSSEACMLGGLALKWQWKKRRQAQGKSTDKPEFVCGPRRCAGRNSRGTSTLRCGRCRSAATRPDCGRKIWRSIATRTQSASWPHLVSRSRGSMSR